MRARWVAVLAFFALNALAELALCTDSIDQDYEETQIDEDGPDQDPLYDEDDPFYDEMDDYDSYGEEEREAEGK